MTQKHVLGCCHDTVSVGFSARLSIFSYTVNWSQRTTKHAAGLSPFQGGFNGTLVHTGLALVDMVVGGDGKMVYRITSCQVELYRLR